MWNMRDNTGVSSGPPIFNVDEMHLKVVDRSWSEKEMLNKDGIFYLKDVAKKLRRPTADFKRLALEAEARGASPWETMGLRKQWTHWVVRMKTFRRYYRDNELERVQPIPEDWDANEMLGREGIFFLNEVCRKIPFKAKNIRYQARTKSDARTRFGVWRDPRTKAYVVDMAVFAAWIRQIWPR